MTDASFDRNQIHCLVTAYNHAFSSSTVATLRETLSQANPAPKSTVSSTAQTAESNDAIFNAARELGTALKARISTIPANDQIALLKYVDDTHGFFLNRLGNKRERSWEVSNIGSIKLSDARPADSAGNEGWRITKSIFTQGAGPVGAAFDVNVAGVEGKGIWITITWQETIVEETLIDQVMRDLGYWTQRLGGRMTSTNASSESSIVDSMTR